MMDCICIAIGAWGLGVASACFAYGWLEASFDTRANIPWAPALDTCINWDLQPWRDARTATAAHPSMQKGQV